MFDSDIICGGTTEGYKDGYKDKIESDNIVDFIYMCGEYSLTCHLTDSTLHVTSNGGNHMERDGSYFGLKYDTDKLDILKELNRIIKDNDVSKENGFYHNTAGLPPGIGDSIEVTYDSGERIYKISNQFPVVGEEIGKLFYDEFHKLAIDNGFDFTTDKSNVDLYNDATVEYLQGTWEGSHFRREYKMIFEGSHIKIYKDGELTDDTDYVIHEGWVKVNKLVDGKTEAKNQHDYQEFNACSSIRKVNDFTITVYFFENGCSSTDRFYRKKEDK